MKLVVVIVALTFLLSAPDALLAEHKASLTIEAIFGGSFYEPTPSEIHWTPDGRQIGYFLRNEGGGREFWLLDVSTGERGCAIPSERIREMAPAPDQASIGERERSRRIRYGIPSYQWAPDGKHILFVSSGQLYLYDLAARTSILLAPAKKDVVDPHFSPDGKRIAFIYQHDLWVVPTARGKERRLTFGGNKLLLHGEPDWIYLEELDVRSGYHWSPDSKHIAFIELDERPVPVYPLTEQSSKQATVDFQIYPKAGDPNPLVRVGIVDLKSRKTVWVDRAAEYIPRVDWADVDAVALQLLNRAQNELELIEANPASGRSRSLLVEKDAHWVDVTDDLTYLSEGRQFLWTSDRSGFHHIYLYDRDGRLIRQITSGDWVVSDIVGVDEKNGWIYYRSNQFETIGLNLFRIRLDGSGAERLTEESGTHRISMNAASTALIDVSSSLNRAQRMSVIKLTGEKRIDFFQPRDLSVFDLVSPEIQEVKTPDGAIIRVLLYKPRNMEPGRKYPLVVYAYGMPGVPTIQDAWAGNRGLFHQFLVQQGFLVAQIDDRSSALPGHKHAVAGYHNLGPLAAKDFEMALQYLKSFPFVDGEATAIWGWSGGGYTAAYHLTHTALFKAGVAVAPVTDWRLYDSIYTERYMGMPDRDPEAYDRSSVLKAAANYQGRLLLIHGTLDDNVHPQNTIQLVDALIQNNKRFDLMLYPDKTHDISGAAASVHLYSTIYEFLERNVQRR
jgi:dipeptidyl-peptidase 4